MLTADPSASAALRGCALALALVLAPAAALAQTPAPTSPPPVPVLVAPAPGAEPVPVLVVAGPAAPAGPALAPADPALAPAATPTLEQEPIPVSVEPEEPRRPADLRAYAPYFPINLALLYPMGSNPGIPELRTNFALGAVLD